MRILIAEDEAFSRNMVRKILEKWGHEVVEVANGAEAWEVLREEKGPQIALLDWMMPELEGIEVVQKVRESLSTPDRYIYIILLTQKALKEEIVQGLEAGADDYMVKPFDPSELRVRIRSGQRIIELHQELTRANQELRDALAQVKKLSGLLPICASCKKIRDDQGYWTQIEAYIRDHSEAEFSHAICPECARKLYPELFVDE